MAYVFLPVGNIFSSSSVWITVLLTVERYISVRYPFKAKELCTSRLARRTIVVIVLLAAIVNSPRFFSQTIEARRLSSAPITTSNCSISDATTAASTLDLRWNTVTSTIASYAIAATDAASTSGVQRPTTRSSMATQRYFGGDVMTYERKSTEFESGKAFSVWTWFSIVAVHVIPCITLLYLNAGLVAIVCRASRRRAALRCGTETIRGGGRWTVTCLHDQQQQQQQQNQHQRAWHLRWPSSSAAPAAGRWWVRASASPVIEPRREHPAVAVNSTVVIADNAMRHHHHSTEQIRMTVTCISIICLFLICIIPSAISNRPVAKALFGRNQTMDEFTNSPFYRLLRVVTNLLVYCNLSLNFLLYCVFNHKFLRTLRLVCCHSWSTVTGHCEQRPPPDGRSGQTASRASTCHSLLFCCGCGRGTSRSSGGDVATDGPVNADEVALNRLYVYRGSSLATSGGGLASRSSSGAGGNGSNAGGSGVIRTPGEFRTLEAETGLPVVIAMKRQRVGYETLRSATCGALAFRYPLREKPKARARTFDQRIQYE